LIIIAIIGIIGGVFTLFTTYHSLVFGRFVLGLAVGLYSAIVPLFINELAPSELAGLFGTFNQLFIVLSVVFTNLLTFVISD
jgi:MFS family permease